MNFPELRAALDSRADARWTADRVSVVDLDGDDFAYLGLPESSLQQSLIAASSTTTLSFPSNKFPPAAVDWRERDGNWLSPVRSQGRCGSCAAFAVCAVTEARFRVATGRLGDPGSLSPAHVFSCGRSGGCKRGMHVSDALQFAQVNGIGSEEDFPYTGVDSPCSPITPRVRLAHYFESAFDLRSRKLTLAQDGPILGTMEVYEDLTHYRTGVYRHVSGNRRGLHAVAIVGYDDGEQCWIVQNSWGDRFGEAGFFRIAYGECGLDTNPVAVVTPEST